MVPFSSFSFLIGNKSNINHDEKKINDVYDSEHKQKQQTTSKKNNSRENSKRRKKLYDWRTIQRTLVPKPIKKSSLT